MADPSTQSAAERLAEAVEADRVDEAARLLRSDPQLAHRHTAKRQASGDEQWLPLHRAAARGDLATARVLLDQGAQPDGRTRAPHDPDVARQTALHLASAGGHEAVARELVARGATVDVRDAAHCTPIALAAWHGRADVVRVLAEAGAALELPDAHGRTPVHLAIMAEGKDAPSDANAAALSLIEAGAYVNAMCRDEARGFTPLHRCVSVGEARLEVAAALLRAGADVDAFDAVEGRTAREWAGVLGRGAYVDVLDAHRHGR